MQIQNKFLILIFEKEGWWHVLTMLVCLLLLQPAPKRIDPSLTLTWPNWSWVNMDPCTEDPFQKEGSRITRKKGLSGNLTKWTQTGTVGDLNSDHSISDHGKKLYVAWISDELLWTIWTLNYFDIQIRTMSFHSASLFKVIYFFPPIVSIIHKVLLYSK